MKEAATLGKRLREIKSRRSRYQEMAAAELIDFDELREWLAGLEDERKGTERALETTQRRAEHLEHLEQTESHEVSLDIQDRPSVIVRALSRHARRLSARLAET